MPTSICGTTVTVGGIRAPLFFVSATQLAFQVPYEANLFSASIVVATNDAISLPVNTHGASTSPGIFTLSDGRTAATQDFGPDGRAFFVLDPNNTNAYASPGDYLVIYGSGFGQTDPPIQTNQRGGSATLHRVIEPPTVTIAGQPVAVQFAGLSPGFVGLYQINLQLPADVARGREVPVVVVSAGRASNTAYIPIR